MRFYRQLTHSRKWMPTLLTILLSLPACQGRNVGDLLPEIFLFDGLNPPMYQVGGAISNLNGSGLVLSNNGDTVTVPALSGNFVFSRRLHTDDAYNVQVATYPSTPNMQLCTVSSGQGTIGNGDVTGILVNCADAAALQVDVPNSNAGGASPNLRGTGLVLLNNLTDPLTINGPVQATSPATSTSFTFHTPVGASYPHYSVSVQTQPTNPSQTCTVSQATDASQLFFPGVIGNPSTNGNPLGPILDCITNRYKINVNVTGLLSGNSLTLSSAFPTYPAEGTYAATTAGSDSLPVSASGASAYFNTAIRSGDPYSLAISAQPTGQSCTLGSTTGTIGSGNLTIPVNCSANSYLLSGTVTGLSGTVTLTMTGSVNQTIPVNANGTWSVSLPYGSTYSLTIPASGQPAGPTYWQTCVLSGASSGSMNSTSGISGVNISCTNNTYTIGGTISGYPSTASQQLMLELNGSPTTDLALAAGATSFTFTTPVASGSSYAVSIVQSPKDSSGTLMYCSTSGLGTVQGSNITGVSVSCQQAKNLNVTVSGYASTFTVQSVCGGTTQTATANGNNTYAFPCANAQSYTISVPTPPANQSCKFISPAGITGLNTSSVSGTMGTLDINLALDCTPVVVNTTPADAATATGTQNPTVTFNKAMSPGSFTINANNQCTGNVQLSHNGFVTCDPLSKVSLDGTTGTILSITPQKPLWYGTQYKIKVLNTVTDTSANGMIYSAGYYQMATGYNTGGLLRDYEFTNPTATTDGAGSGYTLSSTNPPSSAPGVDGDQNGAGRYDGASMYLSGSDGSATGSFQLPAGSTARTMCAWVTLDSQQLPSGSCPNGAYSIVSYGTSSSNNLSELAYYCSSGSASTPFTNTYTFTLTSGSNQISKNVTLPLNSWIHLCGAYDSGTGNTSLYINGTKVQTDAIFQPSTVLNGTLYIGRRNTITNAFHKGKVDGVRIYSAALPDEQIRHLATQVPLNLVARYDFANGSLTDSSGYDNDLGGSATATTDRFGLNSAYSFNLDQLSHSGVATTNTTGWTLSAWIRPTLPAYSSSTGIMTVFLNGNSGTSGYEIAVNGTNGHLAKLFGNAIYSESSAVVPLNVWTHVALVSPSAGNWILYINGGIALTGTANSPNPPDTGIFIGKNQLGNEPFIGQIADARIYNSALSQNHIFALAGFHPFQVTGWSPTAASSSLKLYLEADSLSNLASASNLIQWNDDSGNGNHATAVSTPQYYPAILNKKSGVYFPDTFSYFSRNGSFTGGSATPAIFNIFMTPASGNSIMSVFLDGVIPPPLICSNGEEMYTNSTNYYLGICGTGNQTGALPVAANTPYISSGRSDGITITTQLFGPAGWVGSSSFSGSWPWTAGSAGSYILGGDNLGNTFAQGTLSEVLYFNTPLTTNNTIYSAPDLYIVECYLSAKYGIPLTGGVVCP